VIVNNAGFAVIGAVEEVSDAEVRSQFATNVFGLLNVTRAALPVLRAQGRWSVRRASSTRTLLPRAPRGRRWRPHI
jgi:NAD(P)-dependent dehydrogenase (short-subunit alcohol dehydrogenase family)